MGLTCVLKWPCSPGTFSFMEKWKAPAMEGCVSFTATTLLGAMSRCVLCIISSLFDLFTDFFYRFPPAYDCGFASLDHHKSKRCADICVNLDVAWA